MYLIQNIQVPMQSYYLKLLNMCKFAHDRKTLNLSMIYQTPNNLLNEKKLRPRRTREKFK